MAGGRRGGGSGGRLRLTSTGEGQGSCLVWGGGRGQAGLTAFLPSCSQASLEPTVRRGLGAVDPVTAVALVSWGGSSPPNGHLSFPMVDLFPSLDLELLCPSRSLNSAGAARPPVAEEGLLRKEAPPVRSSLTPLDPTLQPTVGSEL